MVKTVGSGRRRVWIALLTAFLSACGGSPSPDGGAGGDSSGLRIGNLTEPQILAVTRTERDAPLADLSHYAPREQPRATDAALNSGDCADNQAFRFGAAMSDVSGPAANEEMLGYADPAQVSAGLLDRQYARAFAFESECAGRSGRAMLVNLDQALMFHSVRQGVLGAIAADTQDDLGAFYDTDNLMISATHSHASAAGQAFHDLYNVFALGFDQQSYDAMVAGIVRAIRHAHRDMLAAEPAPVLYAQGELLNGNVNRSAVAYAVDPAEEREAFLDTEGREVNTNRMMSLIRLKRGSDDIGALSWYAIHGTSLSQINYLLSGDNKGYAAQRWEKDYGRRDAMAPKFVAGFFNTDSGDSSPNLFMPELSEAETRDLAGEPFQQRGGGQDDYESTLIAGYKQYAHARDLYAGAERKLRGEVTAHSYMIDFSAIDIEAPREYPAAFEPDGADHQRTCQPALGVAFAAGAEDGRGPLSETGATCPVGPDELAQAADYLATIFGSLGAGAIPSELLEPLGCTLSALPLGLRCHDEKPVLLPLFVSPFNPLQGLAPSVQPVQVITLGNLALVALPWEVTTMSGRRIREAVLEVLADAGIDYAVIAGYSNAFAHYLTTREEYSTQQYEGASTLYGPWTLDAVIQEVTRLAGQVRAGMEPFSPYQVSDYAALRTLLVHVPQSGDGNPPGDAQFGDVLQQPEPVYELTDDDPVVVKASFYAGHPRNDLKSESSYLYVERLGGDSWQLVATDDDYETRYRYQQSGYGSAHVAEIEWHLPAGTPAGTYRIRHQGATGDGPYTGVSDSFVLEIP
ncbi:MAG: neutral/alkaline non-lysosomal ceramidase N-terminal domain-containing protein [Pseudomonadota bacterium]|nr:neutral/alkaline non-lysosomal ceramidase N-terminal domain-containing protein [Pseudomonadota bacterium]